MKQLIVGIGPPLGGKSTLCRNLEGFTTLSFAEPLYRMIGDIIGHGKVRMMRRKNQKEDPIPELGGKTLRFALQTLGTEWGREMIYDGIWADHLIRKMKSRSCIDDLRFPNEYEAAKNAGAIFIRLLPHKTLREEQDWSHSSESHWKLFPAHAQIVWDDWKEIEEQAKKIPLLIDQLSETTPTVIGTPDLISFL